MANIFITGIGTDVGKTVASAIITEAIKADYFKPIQAGDLDNSDTMKVQRLISNTKSIFHQSSYQLNTPMSPHAAAEIDNIEIDINKINLPKTENNLVIEGAGGILVPLNDKETILDLIRPEYSVIVVSRHYLGSINHTLMTCKILKEKGIEVSILFNGAEHKTTESIITSMTGCNVIGRINEEPEINPSIISKYADAIRPKLEELIRR